MIRLSEYGQERLVRHHAIRRAACSTILVVYFGASIGALPPNIVDTIRHLTPYPPTPRWVSSAAARMSPTGLQTLRRGSQGALIISHKFFGYLWS